MQYCLQVPQDSFQQRGPGGPGAVEEEVEQEIQARNKEQGGAGDPLSIYRSPIQESGQGRGWGEILIRMSLKSQMILS